MQYTLVQVDQWPIRRNIIPDHCCPNQLQLQQWVTISMHQQKDWQLLLVAQSAKLRDTSLHFEVHTGYDLPQRLQQQMHEVVLRQIRSPKALNTPPGTTLAFPGARLQRFSANIVIKALILPCDCYAPQRSHRLHSQRTIGFSRGKYIKDSHIQLSQLSPYLHLHFIYSKLQSTV